MTSVKITIKAKPRGIHLITQEIENALPDLPESGLLHLFLLHTSAGICINENADPTVLSDMNEWFNRTIKEDEPYYQHTYEGPDDMPAHIKAVLTGIDLTLPIHQHKLHLGTWQGIYLAEFRNRANNRSIMATILG